jgi:hypothetical protein
VSQCETAHPRRGLQVHDAGAKTVRLVPPPSRGIVAVPKPTAARPDTQARHRQQLSHDIQHELGTVMMLASLLASSDDVGPDGRRWASQLLDEARWLVELQNAYQETAAGSNAAAPPTLPT